MKIHKYIPDIYIIYIRLCRYAVYIMNVKHAIFGKTFMLYVNFSFSKQKKLVNILLELEKV